MVQTCFKHVSNVVQTCFKQVPNRCPTAVQQMSTIFQTAVSDNKENYYNRTDICLKAVSKLSQISFQTDVSFVRVHRFSGVSSFFPRVFPGLYQGSPFSRGNSGVFRGFQGSVDTLNIHDVL